MRSIAYKLRDRYYGNNDHPYRVYETTVKKHLNSHSVLLDAGCGREAGVLRKLIPFCEMSIGIDISSLSKQSRNEPIHFIVSDLENKALRDESIDIVVSRSVLEHIEDPLRVYQEIYRVLRPQGYFIFLTPNSYDYASLFARLIPNRFHAKIVRITEGRNEEDTFPTYYRSNTERAIRHLAKMARFEVVSLSLLGQYPSYFMFNPLLFLIGTAYDKLMCEFEILRFLRGWILGLLRKHST
jgi:SAM-dependent methyltransferase